MPWTAGIYPASTTGVSGSDQRGASFKFPIIMNRNDAYAILAAELESWRRLGYSALVKLVGQPSTTKSVPCGSEEISIRVQVRWANATNGSVRVEATADGPSSFRLERLEESVTIPPP
jgi:hypothetical protein